MTSSLPAEIDINIPLCKWQREYLDDPHPIKVLIGGRRTGKTLTAKSGLVETCTGSPGRSIVIMPIQSNANDFFTEMYEDSLISLPPEDGSADPDSDDVDVSFDVLLEKEPKTWPFPRMRFKGTRHRLDFRSFENPKRLRGGNWTGRVVADEANDLDGDAFKQIILPKVLDTTAQVLVTSTITHHNWLWDLYLRGQDPKDKLVKSWKITTPEAIWAQGEKGRQRLADFRSLFAEWMWNAECLCIPGTDGSAIFPYLDQCLTDEPVPKRPEDGRLYIGGLDLGRVNDPEELIIMDDLGTVVFHESFELGMTHENMAQRVAARSRFWNATIVADATGGGGSGGGRGRDDSHIETYRAALPEGRLRPLFWSPNSDSRSKRDIISHLAIQTEKIAIRINRDRFSKLINQMRRYKLIINSGKVLGFGCAEGHDDCVSALAMAEWGRKENWIGAGDGTLPLNNA